MSDDVNQELLQLVRKLSERVESLEQEIRGIRILNAQNVPEETVVAIAAAVAAYMGHRARRRQAHFTTTRNWLATTRPAQHLHAPLHLR